MTELVGSPLDSLRRRILWLLLVGLLAVLIPAAVLLLFDREDRRVRSVVTQFHGPSLAAAQEAMLVLDELRLEPTVAADDDGAWARRQRQILNQLEQRLRKIVELQEGRQWPDAAATVQRLSAPLALVTAAVDVNAASPRPTLPLPSLRVTLDQLRLLHQEAQVVQLRGQTARLDVFFRTVVPLLALLLAGATVLAGLVWRGIRHSLASETRLRDGLVTEIAERKQADETLRQFKGTLDHTNDCVFMFAPDTLQFIYVNQGARQQVGYSEAELLRMHPYDIQPQWPQPRFRDLIAPLLVGQVPELRFETVHRHRDGHDIPVEVFLQLVTPGEGRSRFVAIVHDISQRLRVETELRLKDTAIATSINGIVITSATGEIVYANPAFLTMWRIADLDSLATRSTGDLWQHETPDTARERLLSGAGWSGEVTASRADGSRFPALLSSTAVRDSHGALTHVMNLFVDLTDARAMQEQLVQSQKLESVGRLAGGIAHDFNNLLLVIKGYVEMALASIPEGSEPHADLLEVGRAADSATTLTAQMLTFSRRQIIAPVVLDLNEVVHRIYGMLRRMLGEDVTLRIETAPELWRVRFDPGQAEQILMNLAVNARDAMPDGGQLMLETANVQLDEDYAREHRGIVPGEYVMLAVSDTGTGMSAETLAHAFEPFYTTKATGHGTGLGLAIIHGAVSQNGGRIELYSEAGHGTTFKIYLPRTFEVEGAAVTPPPRTALPCGDETILLVEDDAAVRVLAARFLEQQGYRVHAFDSAKPVLEWLRDSLEPVHLLLSDVIMPGMNGKELAEQIVSMRPGTAVLYVSGYTANVIVHHGVLKAGMEFLAKPYTRAGLAMRVREVLDKAPRRRQ